MPTLEQKRAILAQNTSFYDPTSLQLVRAQRRTVQDQYGDVQGVKIGKIFSSRGECFKAGVHRRTVAGIATGAYGAYSVVISGGYEDDVDEGDSFIYTGTGGQEDAYSGTGEQVEDQSFDHKMNKSLQTSLATKRPVRVVRGSRSGSKYAPQTGYRYDGTYTVTEAYYDKGKSGYRVCKYRLVLNEGQPPIPIRSKY